MTPEDLRSIPPGATVDADLCIVGSGPAGSVLAAELDGVADVLLLESGGAEPSAADDLNTIESIGVPRVLDQRQVRNRVLGGSSSTWWGRSATFDPVDFEERPWVEHSGWPISRADVAPFFARAAQHLGLGVDDNLHDRDLARGPMPAFEPALLEPYRWTYSRDPSSAESPRRFGASAMRPGRARCLVHATVTHIDTDPAGRHVTGLEVRSPDGEVRHVRARTVVIAGGGIENARLLLASNRVLPHGVGNAHDRVGRYLMDHLRGPVASFSAEAFVRVQRLLGPYRLRTPGRGSVRVVPGVALAGTLQRAESLLQAALWVEGDLAEDDPVAAARTLLTHPSPRHAAAVLRGAPMAVESLVRTKVLGRGSLRGRTSMQVHCIVEQAPNPHSRIRLGDRRDALGTPISVIDWQHGAQEARTVRRAASAFVDEMLRLRLPVPHLDPAILDDTGPLLLPDVAHPTGSTRMSADPADGVVDRDCRVHGVDNLFVAGSSVFPTSGHANPTQMLVALAVRLADHLKDELPQ